MVVSVKVSKGEGKMSNSGVKNHVRGIQFELNYSDRRKDPIWEQMNVEGSKMRDLKVQEGFVKLGENSKVKVKFFLIFYFIFYIKNGYFENFEKI